MLALNSDITKLQEFDGKVLTNAEMEVVEKLLKEDPDLWRYRGNLHNLIRHRVLDNVKTNSVEQLCISEGIRQMRISLLAEGSTPLEVIAIDQIINNHIQVIRSGRELERFEPTEDNQAASKHWVRVHNAAQARLIRAVNWLTKLRKVKVDDVIKRKQNKLINFESEFAQSLKNIDKQMEVLERLEDGEELTDEELGIETSGPKPKSQISIEIREMLAKLRENLTFEYDGGEEEETPPDQPSTS